MRQIKNQKEEKMKTVKTDVATEKYHLITEINSIEDIYRSSSIVSSTMVIVEREGCMDLWSVSGGSKGIYQLLSFYSYHRPGIHGIAVSKWGTKIAATSNIENLNNQFVEALV
jgi:hypothetical protein